MGEIQVSYSLDQSSSYKLFVKKSNFVTDINTIDFGLHQCRFVREFQIHGNSCIKNQASKYFECSIQQLFLKIAPKFKILLNAGPYKQIKNPNKQVPYYQIMRSVILFVLRPNIFVA